MPGPAAGVVAADFNHDGWMDLAFTHWASPAITVWRNVRGKSFERIPLVIPAWMRAWGIAALDYDNDGWVDLVAVGETFSGEGRIALFRNEGPAGFRDVSHETGLDKIVLNNPRGVIAFDFDGDGSAGPVDHSNQSSRARAAEKCGRKQERLAEAGLERRPG